MKIIYIFIYRSLLFLPILAWAEAADVCKNLDECLDYSTEQAIQTLQETIQQQRHAVDKLSNVQSNTEDGLKLREDLLKSLDLLLALFRQLDNEIEILKTEFTFNARMAEYQALRAKKFLESAEFKNAYEAAIKAIEGRNDAAAIADALSWGLESPKQRSHSEWPREMAKKAKAALLKQASDYYNRVDNLIGMVNKISESDYYSIETANAYQILVDTLKELVGLYKAADEQEKEKTFAFRLYVYEARLLMIQAQIAFNSGNCYDAYDYANASINKRNEAVYVALALGLSSEAKMQEEKNDRAKKLAGNSLAICG